MCNQYAPSSPGEVQSYFRTAAVPGTYRPGIGPWGWGPFVRQGEHGREAVLGQWALIADHAKEARSSARIMTNNARSETVATKPTFRGPWARGQRCLIPAASFLEPNWESGKNQWWRFRRADGQPWGLAGLWNAWTDPHSGEIIHSYTMLTVNADDHPLMSRMHKPDPRLGPTEQDKRSVVPIEPQAFDQWLNGTVEQARVLIRLAAPECFDAAPQA